MTRNEAIKFFEHLIPGNAISAEATRLAIEALKEQEAMKPISKSRHGANPQIQHFCRRCNAILFHHKQKYCIECGQKVKWE